MLIEIKRFATAALLPGARRTASGNGSGVDVRDYVGAAKVVLISSAGGGATPTLDVKIQDSDDNSTFADVSGAAFTQVTDAAASLQELHLNLDSVKRYIRAVATIAGTTPTFDGGVILIGQSQS